MKQVFITDAVYDRLKAYADEHNEIEEAVASAFIQIALDMPKKYEARINKLKAETEFTTALLENSQLTTRRH